MATVTLQEVFGELQGDADEAQEFLRWWFNKPDRFSIVSIDGYGKVYNLTYKLDPICLAIKDHWDKMIADHTNAYFVTATTQAEDGEGYNRPKKHQFKALRGVYADIDRKPGSFETWEQIEAFIDSLPQKPNAIVRTGENGGAHLYWKVKDINNLDPKEAGIRWWSLLQHHAPEGVEIDRLIDVQTRLLRIPGSIRWPKKDEDRNPERVTIEYTDAEQMDSSMLVYLTADTYKESQERIKRNKAQETAIVDNLLEISAPTGRWNRKLLLSLVDEIVNEGMTWEEILEPEGWTKTGDGEEGETQWKRPGGPEVNARSATVGFEDPNACMSLLSESPDSGLLDLKENEVSLSKWRVLLRLRFNDNVQDALEWITENV